MGSSGAGFGIVSGGPSRGEVVANRRDRLLRMAHVRTMPNGRKLTEGRLRDSVGHELPDPLRRDGVIGALEDQGRHGEAGKVRAIVREEGDLGELACDDRIRRAEALVELARQLGAFVVLHDHRREEVRPADVVLIHEVEQTLDVRALEPSAVLVTVIQVARGWADPVSYTHLTLPTIYSV